MKPINVDKMFEKYLRNVMSKNVGKFTEAEWEKKMPELYEKFGDSPLVELDGQSPRAWYGSLSGKEAAELLGAYVKSGFSVPDYLCDAIAQKPDAEDALFAYISAETEEELFAYCVNLLEDMESEKPFPVYLNALFDGAYSAEKKELMTEILADHAVAVSETVLSRYAEATEEEKGYLLDIVVEGTHSDKAFGILLDAFVGHPEDMPLYVQYLVKYGDERALPTLYRAIETPNLDYLSFQELKNAIESLGGEYEKNRDFTDDRFYKMVRKAEEEKPN